MRGVFREHVDGSKSIYVEFSPDDLLTVRLSHADTLQLEEPPENIADYLLDAELIARRLLEQAARAHGSIQHSNGVPSKETEKED